jgi:hypothetical protein
MCGNTSNTGNACGCSKRSSLFLLKFLLSHEKNFFETGQYKLKGVSLFEAFRLHSKALENPVAKKSPVLPY